MYTLYQQEEEEEDSRFAVVDNFVDDPTMTAAGVNADVDASVCDSAALLSFSLFCVVVVVVVVVVFVDDADADAVTAVASIGAFYSKYSQYYHCSSWW